jgi:CheY-like chemotaxis protein
MNPCTILVVDDDPDIRETLVEILETEGCDAVGASNGVEALTVLRGGGLQPCLILLDLMMPIMDGFTFRDEQRRDPALCDIPVVVISAYREPARNAEVVDAAGHLEKPIPLARLLGFVEEFC